MSRIINRFIALAALFSCSVALAQTSPGIIPAPGGGGGGACVGITIGSTTIPCGGSAGTLTGVTFGWSMGTVRTQSLTTDTLSSTDCGNTVRYTANSAVTVTVPATLGANGLTCDIGLNQIGTGKVSINGTAVSAATFVNPGGTGTRQQGSKIGVEIDANPGGTAAEAILTGDYS
jgi:hypothetical protein